MVKIKISYNTDTELVKLLKLLTPVLKKHKVSKISEGKFKKAYAELENLEEIWYNIYKQIARSTALFKCKPNGVGK